MTKHCEHCRAPVSGGKFCGRCGRPLGSQAAPPAPVWSLVVGDSLPPVEQLPGKPMMDIIVSPPGSD